RQVKPLTAPRAFSARACAGHACRFVLHPSRRFVLRNLTKRSSMEHFSLPKPTSIRRYLWYNSHSAGATLSAAIWARTERVFCFRSGPQTTNESLPRMVRQRIEDAPVSKRGKQQDATYTASDIQ